MADPNIPESSDPRKPDGGPAFPRDTATVYGQSGMTLLDYFAAHAPDVMHEFWAEWRQENGMMNQHMNAAQTLAVIAKWRYAYAYAMLAAREGGQVMGEHTRLPWALATDVGLDVQSPAGLIVGAPEATGNRTIIGRVWGEGPMTDANARLIVEAVNATAREGK